VEDRKRLLTIGSKVRVLLGSPLFIEEGEFNSSPFLFIHFLIVISKIYFIFQINIPLSSILTRPKSVCIVF